MSSSTNQDPLTLILEQLTSMNDRLVALEARPPNAAPPMSEPPAAADPPAQQRGALQSNSHNPPRNLAVPIDRPLLVMWHSIFDE